MIQLGEMLPGGVGSGLYGIVVMALLSVFVAGLMVGRTPEYLGKKIETREIKFAMLAALILPASILGFAAVAAVLPIALKTVSASGPHGLSEILYAYTSATGNNGSAFAGLAPTPYWNVTMGIAMWFGRFGYSIPVLAIAGRWSPSRNWRRRRHPADPRPPVRRLADRRHPDRRRAGILPRPGARANRRALPDAQALPPADLQRNGDPSCLRCNRRPDLRRHPRPGRARRPHQAQSAQAARKPGHPGHRGGGGVGHESR